MKITLVSWSKPGYQRRNDLFAQELGAETHFVYLFGKRRRLLPAYLRYPVQALREIKILRRERPDVMIVENPPIFNVLIAFLFSDRSRTAIVIDAHTGAFVSPKWRWSLRLFRECSRRALVTLVHNTHQEEIVKNWGCRHLVLSFFGKKYPQGERFPFSGDFRIAVIGSLTKKESLDSVFEAARSLPDVSFYITGHSHRLSKRLMEKKPRNCHLTDYLTDEKYVGLLRGTDAVLVQTTREHTLCGGAFEAVAFGTPLILSDTALLKEYFSLGAVHIPNTAEGVYRGVCQARRDRDQLKRDILILRSRLTADWGSQFADLRQLLKSSSSHGAPFENRRGPESPRARLGH